LITTINHRKKDEIQVNPGKIQVNPGKIQVNPGEIQVNPGMMVVTFKVPQRKLLHLPLISFAHSCIPLTLT